MDYTPGPIALMGSGETSNIGGQLFEKLTRNLIIPPVVSVLETPAGFELNSGRVAGRVAEFIEKRLQNYKPKVTLIPARSRRYPQSTENPELAQLLWDSNLIFLGPGSPSYTVRQLSDSLIWYTIKACHRHGTVLVFASAATIAIGKMALPIYEIFKVGEDPYWKPGLDLLSVFGLNLIIIPHWNNTDGGAELDTSRCYIGEKRLNQLIKELPANLSLIGIDENTALIIDFQSKRCETLGVGSIHLRRYGEWIDIPTVNSFPVETLGDFHYPPDLSAEIPQEVSDELRNYWQTKLDASNSQVVVPEEIYEIVGRRQRARSKSDWSQADNLREELAEKGWKVVDSPDGPQIGPIT